MTETAAKAFLQSSGHYCGRGAVFNSPTKKASKLLLAMLSTRSGGDITVLLRNTSKEFNRLALFVMFGLGRAETAKTWLRKLFRSVDYAYKARKYVPISTDSLDDLVEEGGWLSGQASDRMMEMSWMLATFAGWCVVLGMDDVYEVLAQNAQENYPKICLQLWHPEKDLFQHLYFQQACFESGATEAPIHLPPKMEDYRMQMELILESDFGKVLHESPAAKAGLIALDLIACRHFSTPIAPVLWYALIRPGTDQQTSIESKDT